jgi:hypothetical protein
MCNATCLSCYLSNKFAVKQTSWDLHFVLFVHSRSCLLMVRDRNWNSKNTSPTPCIILFHSLHYSAHFLSKAKLNLLRGEREEKERERKSNWEHTEALFPTYQLPLKRYKQDELDETVEDHQKLQEWPHPPLKKGNFIKIVKNRHNLYLILKSRYVWKITLILKKKKIL